jgi:hypothetical protein
MHPSASTQFSSQGPFRLPPDRWFQIVPSGEFRHPSGVVQVVDAVTRFGLVDDFINRMRVGSITGLPVDFDHLSKLRFGCMPGAAGGIGPMGNRGASVSLGIAPVALSAAGSIVAMSNRGDGIWAQLSLTPEGERTLRGGQYRFFSPEFDECSGEGLPVGKVRPGRILGGGLTNRPVLDTMIPWTDCEETDVRSLPNRGFSYRSFPRVVEGSGPDGSEGAGEAWGNAQAAERFLRTVEQLMIDKGLTQSAAFRELQKLEPELWRRAVT